MKKKLMRLCFEGHGKELKKMGNLTELFRTINASRLSDGLGIASMSAFLKRNKTKAFIADLALIKGMKAGDILTTTGIKRSSRTYAHQGLMVYASVYFCPEFFADVLDDFITFKGGGDYVGK